MTRKNTPVHGEHFLNGLNNIFERSGRTRAKFSWKCLNADLANAKPLEHRFDGKFGTNEGTC